MPRCTRAWSHAATGGARNRQALQVLIDHPADGEQQRPAQNTAWATSSSWGATRRPIRCSTPTIATFEDDAGAAYDQRDASGFIKSMPLRMRIAENARVRRATGKRRESDGGSGAPARPAPSGHPRAGSEMFGLSEEQVAEWGMTFGLGAFMLYMLFIIGELAYKAKAGKLSTFILFFVWPSACWASWPKGIIQKLWGYEMSQFDNVPAWSRRPTSISTAVR